MSTAACPACSTAELAAEAAGATAQMTRRSFSIPQIHCAGCIRGVENALRGLPGVGDARVNFSLKRVTVHAEPAVTDTSLIERLARAGFDAFELNEEMLDRGTDAAGHALAWRMGLAGFAMMNVMLLSVAVWSGATDATRDMFHWISAAIALPTTLVAAQPFFASAARALRGWRLNMDVPISLAILLALAMSLFETSQSGQHAYFDAALSLTFFLLIGRFLDHRIKRSARSAARELSALEPSRVWVETPEGDEERPLGSLAIGEVIMLPTGSRLPVDGVLIEGDSLLDTSLITGESRHVPSQPDQVLTAGTINLTGPLRVRATSVGDDTSLRRLAAMVEVAENARGAYAGLADKAARAYAPVVHLLAFAAFLAWVLGTGDIRFAINVAVAVLIITCPCALGLAVPAVATAATSKLFRRGVVLKSDTALERLAEVDTIIFDKTGTLTRTVFDPHGLPQMALPIAKALARTSAHPLSRAVVAGLPETDPALLTEVREVAGFGLTGSRNGKPVALQAERVGDTTQTVLKVGTLRYVLHFREAPLPGVAEMVAALAARNLKTILLSGDSADRVQEVAQTLGLADARAQMGPDEKAQLITNLRAQGKKPLMVGDGLNDTAALALAHASAAPSTALDASRTAADVLFLDSAITVLPEVLDTAQTARARMKQNFAIAAAYNLVATPIACIGLATPLLAAIAMSTSSITVILNAVRGTR